MWGCDAARGFASPEPLPEQMTLRWTRRLPAQRPAWPASQTKLQYDVTYHPIVVGDRLVVGSTVSDALTAYDTGTGEEVWRFYTDGPIRFAPAAHAGRIFTASDDGYLYCLWAEDGQLLWKFRGGPADRRIIGNDRLISSWPIRGGPVVTDGTVYFTASIWPFMGVFVHAVDAETGARVWTNSETGSRWMTHPHGAPSFGSIVPQGYLAVAGDHLIVPGGRSLPAVFDRKTGELLHFQFGGKGSGGWSVTAHVEFYAVGRDVLATRDGSEIGSFPVDILTPELLISRNMAHALGDDSFAEVQRKDRRGQSVTATQFEPGESWPIAEGDLTFMAMAGQQLIGADKSRVLSFDVGAARSEREEQPPFWSAEIDGRAVGVLVGDGKVFVVTEDARIICFADSTVKPQTHALKVEPLQVALSPLAEQILKQGGTEGYALAVGIGDGALISQVVANSQLHVIAIDPSATKVQSFRRSMDQAGLYGERVAAHVGDVKSFDLPPYLANVIFAPDLPSGDVDDAIATVVALYPALRPYGGTLLLTLNDAQHEAFAKAIADEKPAKANVSRNGDLTVLRRGGPLPDTGSWTHQYADASNSLISADRRVKVPLGLLWFGGPSNDEILPRHGHGPSPQVAGGRLVIEGPDMLRCVDVYTGRVLWEKDLPGLGQYYNTTRHFPGAGEIGSNYVTVPDAVYVVYGEQLLMLDAATGETTRTLRLDADGDNPHPAWGYLAASDNTLVCTTSPVTIGGGSRGEAKRPVIPEGLKAVIRPAAKWDYLAGADTPDDWASPDFEPDKRWSTGEAGFGYGDGDDRTQLRDMPGRYTRVYIRKTFDGADVNGARRMVLAVNYDDALIAYLNGKEIVRDGVRKGRGKDAEGISSHEARGYQMFDIDNFRELLLPGKNVLALEGHNVGKSSSDFSLDPYLLFKPGDNVATSEPSEAPANPRLADALSRAKYSSASRMLVAVDRHSGEIRWRRTADYNFRHNAIAVADGKVFCVDSMTDDKLQLLKRRGIEPTAPPRLMALDLKTGEEIWSTDQDVFGTFLSYSRRHDVLLQAGSAYRDRARDEVGRGMVAYRGRDGQVLWKDLNRDHNGPCLLWRDRIITNGGGGTMYELLTGKELAWRYKRMYGCNTAVGSQNLLTFRSGAAGFFDLLGDSGTGNIGGFRSSCTANLIVADGVLSAPDYTRTCSCAYQNQCSLALVHMPAADAWTFSSLRSLPDRIGINLGAPGDRRGPGGTLWFDAPSVGGTSPDLPVSIEGDDVRTVRHHTSRIVGPSDGHLPWVTASCVTGVESIDVRLAEDPRRPEGYTVRLHFAELEDMAEGGRVFNVSINGRRVLEDFDILQQAGGPWRSVVREFADIAAEQQMTITFSARQGRPCVSGVEVVPQR